MSHSEPKSEGVKNMDFNDVVKNDRLINAHTYRDKTGYILISDCDDYVESYDITEKWITTSPARKDALVMQSRERAEHIAEIFGCRVRFV
jgi:hypothetical protein